MNLLLSFFPEAQTAAPRVALVFLGMAWSLPEGLIASSGTDGEEPPGIAEPYGVERYKKLWSTQVFNAPVKAEPPKTAPAPAMAPAVSGFTLRGIAEVQGTQYVYLEDRSGTLHELPVNQPVGDLEVTKITLGDQAATHSVSLRSGADTFVLQFDLTTQPAPPAPVKADRDGAVGTPKPTAAAPNEGKEAAPASAVEAEESDSELELIEEEEAKEWLDEESEDLNEKPSKTAPRNSWRRDYRGLPS